MLALDQLLAFTVTAILLTATPGPDNLMVLGVGMSKGRPCGIAFGLGCAAGCLSHTLLAVIGVSAVIAASPLAFTLLKVAGGLYLIWLGIGALRSNGSLPADGADGDSSEEMSQGRLTTGQYFFKGMVANAINPKVVLFFLSFLPQFIRPEQGSVPGQMAALGVVFSFQAAVLFGLLAHFAGTVGGWLARRPRAGAWLDRVAGTVFVALGVRMVFSR